jgi:hypothetical protein
MKWIVAVLGLLLLTGGPDLRAEKDYPPRGYNEGEPAPEHFGPPLPERSPESAHRGSRRRPGDILFRQFRREVRGMGEEIRENLERIRELEEKLPAWQAGPEKDSAEQQLASLRRRQAELRLELARKKVAFTLRALEVAEDRYQKALAGLEEVRGIVEAEYPDLADLPPVE